MNYDLNKDGKPVIAVGAPNSEARALNNAQPTFKVDCTPSWESLVLNYAQLATEGNSMAREELLRMAKIADSVRVAK